MLSGAPFTLWIALLGVGRRRLALGLHFVRSLFVGFRMMWTVRTDLMATSRVPVILVEPSRIFYMPSEFFCSSHSCKALKFLRHTLNCAEDPSNPVVAEAHERGVAIGAFLNLPKGAKAQFFMNTFKQNLWKSSASIPWPSIHAAAALDSQGSCIYSSSLGLSTAVGSRAHLQNSPKTSHLVLRITTVWVLFFAKMRDRYRDAERTCCRSSLNDSVSESSHQSVIGSSM